MRFVITIVVCFCVCFFLWYRKKTKKGKTSEGMKEVKIVLPDDHYSIVECESEGKPSIIVVNSGLKGFKNRDVFGWNCTLMIEFKDLADNGMPTHEESDIVLDYVEKLDSAIKGNPDHPNALFVARETCDGQMQVYWQVNEPKLVHEYLQSIIQEKSYPREMEYRIEYDDEWKKVEWFLQDFPKKEE